MCKFEKNKESIKQYIKANRLRIAGVVVSVLLLSLEYIIGYHFKFLSIISSFTLIAVLLPSLFIRPALDQYKKTVEDIEKMPEVKKFIDESGNPVKLKEFNELNYLSKELGEYERFGYFIILFICYKNGELKYFFVFLSAWLALKIYAENKIWTGGEAYPCHLGRAKFLINLIGNILSIISTGAIFLIYLVLND